MSIAHPETPGAADDPAAFIDLERYPLTAPNTALYAEMIGEARNRLAQSALLAFPGFLSPDGLRRLLEDAQALEPKAHRSVKTSNPYNVAVTDDMADDHPARIASPTSRHGVAFHDMGGTAMAALYRWPPLLRFVADVLGLQQVFLHEDPSNAVVLQIYKPGDRLAWHFDRAHFSTILQLQKADDGGFFEAAPGIRGEVDENLAGVRAILSEEHTPPFRGRSEPGTFVIIFGRNCLHRVTQVVGEKARISLILSYEEEPGRKLDAKTRKLFFGPDAPDDSA
jgi:hypothetical protein